MIQRGIQPQARRLRRRGPHIWEDLVKYPGLQGTTRQVARWLTARAIVAATIVALVGAIVVRVILEAISPNDRR